MNPQTTNQTTSFSNQFNVSPNVSANNMVNQPTPVSLPTPQSPTSPFQFVGGMSGAIESGNQGVQNLQQQIIQAQTQEASQRNNILNQLLSIDGQDTQGVYERAFGSNIRSITGQDPDAFMQQLTDANTTLATLQGKFRTAEQRISGGQGQSKVFESAQLNELDRQKAVEVGNQALIVQALQGNFDTARQIALDTANFASEDKKTELNNLLKQYDALTGIVDQQTQQLLDQEKQKVQMELMDTERTQNLVDSAIVAGMATVEEMQYLTSTQVDNATKQRIAMGIINRGGAADRAFANRKEFGSGSSNLTSENASIDDLVQAAQFLAPKFSSKFQQESFNNQVQALAGRGDRKGLQDFLVSSAISTLPSNEMKDKLMTRKGLVDGLANLSSLMQEFENAGGNTNIFTGNRQRVQEAIGNVGDPQLSAIAQNISLLTEDLARMQTGAAITKEEEKRFREFFPSARKTKELNAVRLEQLSQSLNRQIENTLASQLGQAGYTAVSGAGQTSNPQQMTVNGITYTLGADGKYYAQ